MPKDFFWGPVIGQNTVTGHGVLPLTPLKNISGHTFPNNNNIKNLLIKSRIFFLLPILIIFISCMTVSPINQSLERPEVFSTFGDVQPRWLAFTDSIGYYHGKIAEPELEFWALKIDLRAPDTRIVVRGGSVDDGDTFSTKVSSFVRNNSLAAGINAVPFDVVSAVENRPVKNIGIVISGGRLVSPAVASYDALVFYTDGRAAIESQSAIDSAEGIENAIGGFRRILTLGEPAERTYALEARHPRSAAGLSANGEYLYLLVVDGRRAGSVGSTERETALILRALGSWEGINFDGGGSSALVLRYPDGRIRPVNIPIHGGVPGLERAVAGCIGIAVSPSTEK
jgi:hypothetical protein